MTITDSEDAFRNLIALAPADARGGATCLADLRVGLHTWVYGVVTDFKPPTKSRGTDYTTTISVCDPTLPTSSIKIIMFHPDVRALPDVGRNGVIVKTHIKVQKWGDKLQGITGRPPKFCAEILDGTSSCAFDNQVFQMLHAWWTANEHASIEAEPAFERPVFRVRDIEELNVFFDLVAKIVHIDLNTDNYEQLNLHVTDYTINDRLPAPEFEFDDSKFPIMDNMVFRCTLWDEHVINARHLNLTPGMYVFLRNVRSKWNDMTGDLEGAMHGDRVYTGRNGIFILDETHPDTEHIRTAEQMLRIQKMPPTTIKDPTLVITSIKDVLAFPHVPYKFRVKAKVVDHRPQNIADFCKLWCEPCNKSLEVDATKCETCHGTPKTYEFRFMLLLSDGTGYLRLIVTSSDELFNGLQPTNLRQNDQALTELKRILSRLWDTSVEKGEGFVKDGRNFDCCVKSYEVRKGDEKSLRYRVFDTLINS